MFTSVFSSLTLAKGFFDKEPPIYTDEHGEPHAYQRLAEHTITSKNYELSRLLPEYYGDIFFIPERREFIIWADKYLRRYSEEGELLDILENRGELRRVGVSFKESGYNDWVISGEIDDKVYVKDLDDTSLSEADLKSLIDTADNVDYDLPTNAYEKKEFTLFLKTQMGWSRVRSKKLFNLYDYTLGDEHQKSWLPLKGMQRHATHQLLLLDKSDEWDVNSMTSPMVVKDYLKTGKSGRGFLDINNQGWKGTYGHGYLALMQNGENLHFQIEIAQIGTGNDGRKLFSPDFEVMMLPKEYRTRNSAAFLVLEPRSHEYRPRDELGMYVLRPKVRDTSKSKVGYLSLQYPVELKLVNLQPRHGEWRSISYINGLNERFTLSLDSDVPVMPRPLPSQLEFYWQYSTTERMVRKFIQFNQTYLQFNDNYSKVIHFGFDHDEIGNAFKILGTNEPISLQLEAEKYGSKDLWESWRLLAINSKHAIELCKTHIGAAGLDYSYSDDHLQKQFELLKWDKSHKYDWEPKVSNEQIPPGFNVNFINDETVRDWYAAYKSESQTFRSLPKKVMFDAAIDTSKVMFNVSLNEAETIQAFEALGAEGQKLYLEFEPQWPRSKTKVWLYSETDSIELKKAISKDW